MNERRGQQNACKLAAHVKSLSTFGLLSDDATQRVRWPLLTGGNAKRTLHSGTNWYYTDQKL